MQRILIILGIFLLALGLLWSWLGKLPFGRLPGDFVIERENFRFYFPLTTMLFISALITLVLWLFRR
jgi:hypothetical protein